jgi:hypothetical protein
LALSYSQKQSSPGAAAPPPLLAFSFKTVYGSMIDNHQL